MEKHVKTHTVAFSMLVFLLVTVAGCVAEPGVESLENELTESGAPMPFSSELADWGEEVVVHPDSPDAGTTAPLFVGSLDIDERPNLGSIEFERPCECRFRVSESNGLLCMRMVCEESCPERTRQCASLIGGCTLQR